MLPTSAVSMTGVPTSRLNIDLTAEKLKNLDTFSKSDPFAVLSISIDGGKN